LLRNRVLLGLLAILAVLASLALGALAAAALGGISDFFDCSSLFLSGLVAAIVAAAGAQAESSDSKSDDKLLHCDKKLKLNQLTRKVIKFFLKKAILAV